MARKLSDVAAAVTYVASMSGAATKAYAVRRGDAKTARGCNILVFGKVGTGKTYLLIDMLLAGLKVFVLMTDFGDLGLETVYNWFHNNPEHEDKLKNLYEVKLDYRGVVQFVRDPTSIMPDIYDVNPDVLFWDGLTAYQQVDLENEISGGDILREDSSYKDWRSTLNGTLNPLMYFLRLHNLRTGDQWIKVVTTLEESKGEYRGKGDDRQLIPGTEKVGPALHTGARTVAGAGFSIILRTVRESFPGGKDKFYYVSHDSAALVKQRGYELPEKMEANFGKLWREHIAPRLNREEKVPVVVLTEKENDGEII